jgi:tetratricopeptide (TPR) repeat protein
MRKAFAYWSVLTVVLSLNGLAQPVGLVNQVLAAPDAAARDALLSGRTHDELVAALPPVEKAAAAAFEAGNAAVALNRYQSALALARAAGDLARPPLYLRRLGLVLNQLGRSDDAIEAYPQGIAASEAAGDNVMLAENLHGAANRLQAIGHYQEALPLCE